MRHHAYERTRACCTYSLQTACTETHAFVQGVPGNVLHELADVQRVQRFAIFVRNTCIFAKRFVHTFGRIPRAGEVCKMSGFECSPMPRFSANKRNSHHGCQLQIELSHAATRDASRNFVQHLLEHAETKHSTKQQRKRRIHITLARAIRVIRLLGLLATKKFKLRTRARQLRRRHQQCSRRVTSSWRPRGRRLFSCAASASVPVKRHGALAPARRNRHLRGFSSPAHVVSRTVRPDSAAHTRDVRVCCRQRRE